MLERRDYTTIGGTSHEPAQAGDHQLKNYRGKRVQQREHTTVEGMRVMSRLMAFHRGMNLGLRVLFTRDISLSDRLSTSAQVQMQLPWSLYVQFIAG